MKKKKGVALAFTLFALVILATFGLGMLIVMLGSSKGSFAYTNSTLALNNATAGVERSIAELENNVAWTGPDTESIGNGSFTVSAQSLGPNGNGLSQWIITSTGAAGGASRTVTAVLSQQTFAQYGYLSNNENLPGEPNQEWWIGGNIVEGPVGTNGFFKYYSNPAYTGKVTSANGCYPGEYCGNDPAFMDPYWTYPGQKGANTPLAPGQYTQRGIPNSGNPQYFYNYFSGYGSDYPVAYNGSSGFSFNGGQSYIPWPTVNVQNMSNKANQIYSGDTKMTLNSDGTITVVTGGSIKYNRGVALSYSGGTSSTYPIPPSGATLYVEDGNVMVSGTLKGQLTIVTGPDPSVTGSDPPSCSTCTWPGTYPPPSPPPNANVNCGKLPSTDGFPPNCGNVDIEGDITYHDKTICSGSNNTSCDSYSGSDRLGVVATGDVNVDPYAAPSNVEVDGSLMAMPQTFAAGGGGTTTIHTGVGVLGYNYTCDTSANSGGNITDNGSGCTSSFCSTCPPAKQNFYLFGGMLPELGGDPVGIFDPGSGRIVSGYNQVFFYDTNMANNPPPNFPITGRIKVTEWKDSNALGH